MHTPQPPIGRNFSHKVTLFVPSHARNFVANHQWQQLGSTFSISYFAILFTCHPHQPPLSLLFFLLHRYVTAFPFLDASIVPFFFIPFVPGLWQTPHGSIKKSCTIVWMLCSLKRTKLPSFFFERQVRGKITIL